MARTIVPPARDEDGFLLKDPQDDGAVSLRYGLVDVVHGWPLRCSHSPAEANNTRDLDALGKVVEVIARKW